MYVYKYVCRYDIHSYDTTGYANTHTQLMAEHMHALLYNNKWQYYVTVVTNVSTHATTTPELLIFSFQILCVKF